MLDRLKDLMIGKEDCYVVKEKLHCEKEHTYTVAVNGVDVARGSTSDSCQRYADNLNKTNPMNRK